MNKYSKLRAIHPLLVENQAYHERARPYTVTRGLSYYIGPEYSRLKRLIYEHDHAGRWHSYKSYEMIADMCNRLHTRMYKKPCFV